MGSSTPLKPTTFHLSLHHLHYIKTEHNLLMQPRLLITLCIAPRQIMLSPPPPSRTFLRIDSAKNPSPSLTFCIWHFAAALMVEGGTAVGFLLRLHHYHAVKLFPAVLPGPNKRAGSLYLTGYFYQFAA